MERSGGRPPALPRRSRAFGPGLSILGVSILVAGCAGATSTSERPRPRATPPERGAAELAYQTNQNDASVSIIDLEAMEVVATIDLTELGYSPTAKPHHTAVEPDGSYWYVTLISDGRILKFDRDNRLVGEAAFETPGLLALDPGSDRLYVGRSMAAVNPPPRIGVIDRSDMSLEEVDVFLPRPHGIAVGSDGELVYTASLAENRLAAVDPAAEAIELVDVEGPHHSLMEVAVSPDGGTLVATAEMSHELLVFDLSDPMRPELRKRIPVNPAPWHPAFTPDGREVWFGNRNANTVTVVETESWTVLAVIEGEGLAQPHGLVVSPDGSRVFVSNENQNGSWVPPGEAPPAEGEEASFPGTVVVIDRERREIVKLLEVGRYASGMSTRAPGPH